MNYRNSKFYVENISIGKLAKSFQTPFYCYSKSRLNENIKNFNKNFEKIKPLICFSVKSNSNSKLLKIIKDNGLGADVVSMGELQKVLKVGFKPNKIVFSGVGKTISELDFAIKKKILLINVESESELKNIINLSKNKKSVVNVGIRLNPNVNAQTIGKISTGRMQDKFGLAFKEALKIVEKYKNLNSIRFKCLSVHIGSQILSNVPYQKMIRVVNSFIEKVSLNFEYVDFGGGMGIDYSSNKKNFDFKKLALEINKFSKKNECKIILEPGRSIIGDTAVLISKVIYIKENQNKDFIILDAGMNDLIRPALYNAKHMIIPANKSSKKSKKEYDFVGPICETSDRFLKMKKFQKLNEGDIVILKDVGAYGYVLSSNYNVRPMPKEVLVDKSKTQIISKRQSIKDLI
jgi:diaminopimelate decarboxylase